ncbi:WYL domain-containing protein [Pseudobutyrivibrio xylanivorans]|uniref:WYL domain-containing protein n=1 Tax=Pseudobutyrivibrio xylanivorans TaxID=185007 RepID=A0A5P6VRQ7_PSEXY|nr:WYL domain-containing protein [Pseudobutyrivibrio xylanivorans]QFJ55266.1 WYL domain-containing protein [Pseudobutyrivibrio xylanivorans]
MNKKNNAKELLINYLLSNKGSDILRESIIKDTGISKSRLSELINELRSDGYEISTPNRSGIVRLESSDILIDSFTNKHIRQWLILLILSKNLQATFSEIIGKLLSLADSSYMYENINFDENYSDMDIIEYLNSNNRTLIEDINQYLSIPTLRKDLSELCGLDLIERKRVQYKDGIHVVYSLTEKAPRILFESEDELYDFMIFYDNCKDSTLESIQTKASKIYDWDTYDTATHIYGKSTHIDKAQLSALNRFTSYKYKEKALIIEYTGINGPISIQINSGLIFYSMETSCFYLLCLNITENMIAQLRLDRIDHIAELPEKNPSYRSLEIMRIYTEMFSASYSPTLSHVKVIFQEFGNIPERVKSLHKRRKNSKLYTLESPIEGIPHTLVYEDDVRGLSAFSRYVRSFGSSALVIEPKELQDNLINSFSHVLANYERGIQ